MELAADEFGYKAHAEWQELVQHRSKALYTSQPVEDLNNSQKNMRQVSNWGGRYRRPQTALAATVRAQTLHNMWKLDTPPAVPVLPGTLPLAPKDLCVIDEPSIPAHLVATYQQKAPYPSCAAENIAIGYGDVCVLRALEKGCQVQYSSRRGMTWLDV